MNSTQKTVVLLSTSALAAGAAQGAVLYKPINVTIPGNATLTLDLNQDTVPDFKTTGSGTKPYIDNTPNSGSAFVLAGGNQGLPLTPVGTMIDASYQIAQATGYFNKELTTGNVVGGWTAPGDNEGYVGLEMVEGDGTHYGWAHFIYNATNKVPNVNSTGSLRLIDAAIETTPYVGIPAGQTADAGLPAVAVSPSPQTGYLGGTAQLTAMAQGYPAPSFQWQAGAIGGGVYTNIPNGTGVSHGALNTLTLRNLTMASMADYVVVASNSSGSVTSSVPATLTVLPASDFPATLTHRYSFQDTPGSTTFADSVGGSAWDGTLYGSASLTGSALQLNGTSGCYAALPSYIMGSSTQMTVEFWADIGSGNPIWTYIFAFGEQVGGAKTSGLDYSPYGTDNWQNADLRDASGNLFANCQPGLLGATGKHITLVVDPPNNAFCFYNGTNLVSSLNWNNLSAVPSLTGINDVDNWLGRSFYTVDPYLNGKIHEFRIYDGVLPLKALALNDAVGPDQYIELSANPTLRASLNSANVVLSWPASDYGFSLQAKSGVTSATTWSTLTNVPALVGTNWQVSLPSSSSPRFFRLIQ
jgi:hypothetical protein